MSEKVAPNEIPVALLTQALLDLRQARRSRSATRQALLVYFRAGIKEQFDLDQLVNWLFFWPNNRQSAFAQAGYSDHEACELIDMLKRIPINEIGLDDQPSAG
jgi:hypothetical protein